MFRCVRGGRRWSHSQIWIVYIPDRNGSGLGGSWKQLGIHKFFEDEDIGYYSGGAYDIGCFCQGIQQYILLQSHWFLLRVCASAYFPHSAFWIYGFLDCLQVDCQLGFVCCQCTICHHYYDQLTFEIGKNSRLLRGAADVGVDRR